MMEAPIRWTDPTMTVDVLRVVGIHRSRVVSSSLALASAKESGCLAYRWWAHRVRRGKQAELFAHNQARLLRRRTRILVFCRRNRKFRTLQTGISNRT